MPLHPIDLNNITDSFQGLAKDLLEYYTANHPGTQDPSRDPSLITQAMQRVLVLMRQMEQQQAESDADDARHPEQADAGDIHQLGEYGINLLADLSSLAAGIGMEQQSREFEALCLPFSAWIARHGGLLDTLEPIVNALAYQANAIREPLQLEQLYAMTGEIQQAVRPVLQQDLEKSNPRRPWRILLLNRAIIATRSHRPELIELAYENLLRYLPEEAPQFFREGMGQMEALNYPQTVREVVARYYQRWSVERTLH